MKRTITSFLALGLLGAVSATGCGDDGNTTSSGGTPPAPIAIAELSTEMGSFFCGLVYSCCTPMEQVAVFKDFKPPPTNEAECKTVAKTLFDTFIVGDLKAGVDAGRLKYDGALAASCFEANKTDCSIIQSDGPFSGPGCDKVFVGLVADGGDCADANECSVAGSVCNKAQGAMLGKCQPLPKEGESCANIFECAAGLGCGYVNMMDVCVKPVANGQPCNSGAECISKLCDFNTMVCIEPKAIGMACVSGFECVDGAYCDSQMNKCAAQKAGGAACVGGEECLSYDCDMMTMKCVDAPADPQCKGM